MDKKYTICRLCSAACPVVVYLENGKILTKKGGEK